jgi:plasmid replication initiation protein
MKRVTKDMLVYSNDLRLLTLPKMSSFELKVFIGLLYNLQGKGGNEARIFYNELKLGKIESRQYLTEAMDSLQKKFATYAINTTKETPTHIIKTITLFFKKIEIHYTKENPNDGYDTSKLFECIDVQINEEFVPLINELTREFTQIEMTEIMGLLSARNVLFYLDLKTCKETGKFYITLDRFKARYHIPEKYRIRDIDREIFAPMLKELGGHNLFDIDKKRTLFEDLKVTKNKVKGQGRWGGVVKSYEISFKPQPSDKKPNELEQANKTIETQAKQIKQLTKERDFAYQQSAAYAHAIGVKNEYQHYVERHYRNSNGECLKITDIVKLTGGALKVEFKNQENESKFYREFDSENHFKKYLGNLTSY